MNYGGGIVERYIINGGNKLKGEVSISGAKNAVLPILAATIISGKTSIISNIPDLRDVNVMMEILKSLGIKMKKENGNLIVDSHDIKNIELPEILVREMRSSIILMGALLARTGEARISYPGGCEIGPRPIDLHLKSLRQLGVKIEESHGYLHCKAEKLEGCEIQLDYPSVGATENIMLAAVKAKGLTTIRNAAREPEIMDLQDYLNKIGARVMGAGTSVIRIEGVEEFHSCSHSIIPDRIVAGTFMIATAITGGEVLVKDIVVDHVQSIIAKLRETGTIVLCNSHRVKVISRDTIEPIEMLKTLPFPGFPTDIQAQFMALLTIANGTSIINETIFENRFKHAEELMKMGANIKTLGRVGVIKGVNNLTGAKVYAKDLRGGAALVLAGLAAHGITEVENIEHIDRGYDNFHLALQGLGADIKREI